MHTAAHCTTLDNLSREEAINAIHQALIQFQRMELHGPEGIDNGPAMRALVGCMQQAGHVGFMQ